MEKIKSELPAPKLVRKVQQNVLPLPLSLTIGKALLIEAPDYVELYFLISVSGRCYGYE